MTRKALICGISGQDGSYLAQHLLERGYRIVGTSRDAEMNSLRNLDRLGIRRTCPLTVDDPDGWWPAALAEEGVPWEPSTYQEPYPEVPPEQGKQ